jgi:acetoin utilization protein AcuB
MIVGMWMTRNLVTIQPEDRISRASYLMRDNHIRRLPVVRADDPDRTVVGLISATDLYRSFPANINPFTADPGVIGEADVPVAQVMTQALLTTSAETPIEDAATTMRDRKIGALPVVRANSLVGLITESDIFRAFVSVLKSDGSGTRITFSMAAGEDVFALMADCSNRRKIKVSSLMFSTQDAQTVCVVRISGPEVADTVADLWKSGHQVLNVLSIE